MKRTTKQITVAGLFACAFAAASFGAISFNAASADVATSDNITMYKTASLRLEETLDEGTTLDFGLRFKTQVNAAWYDSLTNPQVYTLLLPTSMLNGELTAATSNVLQADLDEEKKYSVDDGQTYLFNTVLTEIPETAYGAEISVRSYITADGMEATYSPLIGETYASAARSVVQVADAALNSDAEKWDSVKKYLITGIDVPDDRYLAKDSTSNANAKLLFADGTSETVQASLTEKYKLSYVSDNEQIVEVAEDGTLTAVSTGTANITVSNEALGLSKTVKVTVYEATEPTYGVMSFENLDMVDDVKAYNNAQNLKLVEDGISFYHEGKSEQWVGFSLERPAWLANFDTMTITVELTDGVAVEGGTNWLFYGITGDGYYTLSEGSDRNLNLNNSKNTYVFDLATLLKNKNMTNVVEDAFTFYVSRRQQYAGQSATFTIGAPKFAINDIAIKTGETVNLYEKFHTEAGKANFTFTANGVETLIENPEAYAGAQDGVITATISMNGYADGTVTANYNYTKLLAYGTVIDFTDIDESLLTDQGTDLGAGTYVNQRGVTEYNGQQAIWFEINHEEADVGSEESNGVRIKLPDYYKNFTSYSVTYVLVEETETSTASTNWRIVGNSNYKLVNVGDELTWTSTLSDDNVTKDDYLKAYTKLGQKNNVAYAKFYITDIKLGFADITVGDAFSWENYGIAVSELSNVIFNGEAVADASAFAATEAGTLTFTVTKEGYAPTTFTINIV